MKIIVNCFCFLFLNVQIQFWPDWPRNFFFEAFELYWALLSFSIFLNRTWVIYKKNGKIYQILGILKKHSGHAGPIKQSNKCNTNFFLFHHFHSIIENCTLCSYSCRRIIRKLCTVVHQFMIFKWVYQFEQWFSNFLARGTLKETKNFSRHTQANFDRKTVIFRLVEKKLRHPLNFWRHPKVPRHTVRKPLN